MLPQDTNEMRELADHIHDRIEKVCDILGYAMEHYSIDQGVVEVFSWEYTGCGQHESKENSFPIEYLVMPDELIRETAWEYAWEHLRAEKGVA